MRDNFASLAECAAIWDIKTTRKTDKFRERTIAESYIERESVKFSLHNSDLIQWEQNVPHLQNANGGDIFLYPGFILYRASKAAFSVIDFHDVKLTIRLIEFAESESIPSDTKTIGQTWAKTNKDGSRDRRFTNNYQIPIVNYGELTLKSHTGLWEEYHFSNPDRLKRFVKAWKFFTNSFQNPVNLNDNQREIKD